MRTFKIGLLLWVAALVAAVNGGFPEKGYAWSCANSLEPERLYEQHDAVFAGKVVKLDGGPSETGSVKHKATFEINQTWKKSGISDSRTEVVYSAGSEFEIGKEYLVYAYKTTEDQYLYSYAEGELATDTLCGGIKPLDQAGDDLNFLKQNKNARIKERAIEIANWSGTALLALLAIRFMKRSGNAKAQ